MATTYPRRALMGGVGCLLFLLSVTALTSFTGCGAPGTLDDPTGGIAPPDSPGGGGSGGDKDPGATSGLDPDPGSGVDPASGGDGAVAVDPAIGFIPLDVALSVSGGGSDVEWDLDDGSAGVGQAVSHRYNEPGLYTPTATSGGGQLIGSAQVAALPPMEIAAAQGNDALSVELQAAIVEPYSEEFGYLLADPRVADALQWELGDGATHIGRSLTHTYAAAGNYTVRLCLLVAGATIGCQEKTVTITIPEDPRDNNLPPVAVAPADQTVIDQDGDGFHTAGLDGGRSSDPDGSIVLYRWSEGEAVLSEGASPRVQVRLAVGVHNIRLTVFDDGGLSAFDDTVVTVNPGQPPANQPPVANAGPDQEHVSSGGDSEVTLDGSGSSDPDGQIVRYEWTLGGQLLDESSSPTSVVRLGVGVHQITLKVEDNDGAQASDILVVSIRETGSLSVTPSGDFASAGPAGGPFSPASQRFTLTNNGGEPIEWSAGNSANWTSISAVSGDLNPGESADVDVSLNANANGLAPGDYADTITFTNATNGQGDATRRVELSVEAVVRPPPGVLSVTPAGDFHSSGNAGGPFTPASQRYTITNIGGQPIQWAASKTRSWLLLSNDRGNLPAGASTEVDVSIDNDASGLTPGNYSDTVTFTNETNGEGNTTRRVELTVNSPPGMLSVTPATNFDSSGFAGGPFTPASAIYIVSNTAGQPINWTAAKTQSWVNLSKTSGTLAAGASDQVEVLINSSANSLSPGNYADTVSFTNTTNGSGNTTRDVNLTINASPGQLSVTPTGSFSSSGNRGGPFSPGSKRYTLSNTGGQPVNWTAQKAGNWVSLSGSGGTIPPGASVDVDVSLNANAYSNPPGNYADTVTFTNTSNGAGNTARDVDLTVNSLPGALSVTPSGNLNSSGTQGGPFSPVSQRYTLSNTGEEAINWTAQKTRNWVSLSSSSGSLAPGASVNVDVTINSNANSLTAGNYNDTVTFTNTTNGAGNANRTVNLTVNPPPGVLSVTPAGNLNSSGNQGGPFSPNSQRYTLSNTGGQAINWTAQKTRTWVSLSSASGSLAPGASVNVDVTINSNANSLTAGNYNDTVTFTNTTNGAGNANRAVNLTVNPPPGALSVTPAGNLDSAGNQGGPFSPNSQRYTLNNTGGQSINWTAQKTRNWVSLSSASGSLAPGASANVDVTINSNANSLTAGNYNDTVTFTNTTNGSGNANRAVNLTVSPAPGNCITGNANWQNDPFASQTGLFSAEFDGTPAAANIDGVTGLSLGAAADYADLAVIVRFNTSGTIDARDAGAYRADAVVNYSANSEYHFRLMVNVSARTYSVYVTPQGGGEVTLAANYAFRTEQGAIASVDNLAVLSSIGSHDVCDFSVTQGLEVTPSSNLTSAGFEGGPFSPSNQQYTLVNRSAAPLNWSVSKTRTWVSLSATSGSLNPGASTIVTVSINSGANSLAAGNYSDTVTFTNTTNGVGNTTRDVELTVSSGQGALSVTPTGDFTSSGNEGGPFSPSSMRYTLSNTGNQSINWTATKTRNWVSLSVASGSLAGGASVNVDVSINSNANGLAPGNYADTVTLTNTTNGVGNTTRDVDLTVRDSSSQPMTTASRTSGVAPLAVFFDAVTTSTTPSWNSGVVQPADGDYSTFDYDWDFDDAGSGVWPTNGKSKNTAVGHIAAHVFESPGLYRVGLQIRDASGAVHNYYQDVTVLDPEQVFSGGTYYISSSAGNDGNNGTSPSTPFRTFPKAMSVAGPNRRILFKRGDTWDVGATATCTAAGPVLLGAYGTGARPLFNITAAVNVFNMQSAAADWRFSDLWLRATTYNYSSNSGSSEDCFLNRRANSLVLRCRMEGFYHGVCDIAYGQNNLGVVECEFYHNRAYGIFAAPNTVNVVPQKGFFVLGCDFDGVRDEHLLRPMVTHVLVNSNRFQNAPNVKHHLKLAGPNWTATTPAKNRYSLVSDNEFIRTSGGSGWMLSIGSQDSTVQYVEDVIIERNLIRSNPEDGVVALQSRNAHGMVFRNNVVVGCTMAIHPSQNPPGLNWSDWKVYNNTHYTDAPGDCYFIFSLAPSGLIQDWTVTNNIVSYPNMPSNASGVILYDTTNPPSEYAFDYNLYDVRLRGARFRVGGSGEVSLAQWQASGQDLRARTGDPRFVDPANRNFQIQPGGPSVDAGLAVLGLNDDYLSAPRPQGASFDIGAFEQ